MLYSSGYLKWTWLHLLSLCSAPHHCTTLRAYYVIRANIQTHMGSSCLLHKWMTKDVLYQCITVGSVQAVCSKSRLLLLVTIVSHDAMQHNTSLFGIYKSIALQNDLFSSKFFFRWDDYQIADVVVRCIASLPLLFLFALKKEQHKKRGKQVETRSLPKRSVKLAFLARSNTHNA